MSEMVSVALPKGRLGDSVYGLFERAGYGCPQVREGGRRLIFESPENGVRFFFAKPSDVAIYVERGAADIGVCGRDILLEYEPDVYELLDFGVGRCRMCVCGFPDADTAPGTLRVATKFQHIARSYYAGKGRDIDLIHLNGSIELAPVVGLSDVIVDIVETGATLRENGLSVLETVTELSARLIAGKSSYKFKYDAITELTRRLAAVLQEDAHA